MIYSFRTFTSLVGFVMCLGLCLAGDSWSAAPGPTTRSATRPTTQASTRPTARVQPHARNIPTSRPVPGKASASPKRLDMVALRKALEKISRKYKQPGIGVAVATRDKVLWAGGVGLADLGKKTPVGVDTMFRIGSVSKVLVALGFLKLIEQGKVKLDAVVRTLAPDVAFTNAWSKTAPIRLVHLLEHTSGFDDMHFNELYNVNHAPNIPMKQALAVNPGSRRARWRPGTWVSYSNPGYALAGYVMEKITGQPFEAYLQKEVLQPLGMTKSSFLLTPAVKAALAQGYERVPARKLAYHHIYLRPAGSLHASPRDMAALIQFFLRRGKLASGQQLITPQSLARMERPESPLYVRKANIRYGYGIGNYTEFIKGFRSQGHNGGIDGFLSEFKYFPSLDVGYALLINRSGLVGYRVYQAASQALRKSLLGNMKKPASPKVSLKSPGYQRWVGTYQMAHVRNQLMAPLMTFSWVRVSTNKNKLYFQRAGFLRWSRPVEMIPVGRNLYRLPKQDHGQISFAQEHGRTIVFLGRPVGAAGFVREASWKPMTYMWLTLLIALSLLSSLGFALIWGFRKVLGQMEGVPYWRVRAVPLLATLCLLGAILSITGLQPIQLTTPNLRTVSFSLFTWAYVVLTFASLWVSMRSFSVENIHPGVRWHSLIVSLAHLGTVMFIWPWVGLRTWAGW